MKWKVGKNISTGVICDFGNKFCLTLFVSLYNQLPESETKPIFKLASAFPFKPKAKPKSSNKLLNNKFVVLKTP